MGPELLTQHINDLLKHKAEEISIDIMNTTTFDCETQPQECLSRAVPPPPPPTEEGKEEDDIVTELLPSPRRARLTAMSFHIVSDNPRSHVRRRKTVQFADSSSISRSSSAPVFGQQYPRQYPWGVPRPAPCARWQTSSPSKTRNLQAIGLGSRNSSKISPSRRSQVDARNQGARNASWDSKPSGGMVAGMDKKRLQSLGLGGIASSSATKTRQQVGPTCRWSIPKHGSDSALIYPRRQRDL